MNFGQVTSGTLVSLKTPTLSRFSATTTRHLHQPQFFVISPKPHHSAVSSTSLFCKKISFSYKPEERLRFYSNSNGGWQPMWITDSRVKPVESVWSLVGIETLAQSGAPLPWLWSNRNRSRRLVRKTQVLFFFKRSAMQQKDAPALQGHLSIVYSTRWQDQSYSNHASRSPFCLWFLEEQSYSK